MKRSVYVLVCLIVGVSVLLGCGSGGGGGGLQFGKIVAQMLTAQPVVTASGQPGVVIQGVAGGAVSSLTYQDSSPTLASTRISFVRNNARLMVATVDGATVSEFPGIGAGASTASWSPDGARIAFCEGVGQSGNLAVMNAMGGGKTAFPSAAWDLEPAWSADGSQIVFTRNLVGTWQLFRVSSDGSGLTNLSSDTAFQDRFASIPRSANEVFYHHGNPAGGTKIQRMALDGAGKTDLSGTNADDQFPTVSPNGSMIAFMRNSHAIALMDRTGANRHDITAPTAGMFDYQPQWSPDGSKIVFRRWDNAAGKGRLWMANVDGTNEHPLFASAADNDNYPTWSPFFRNLSLVGAAGQLGQTAAGIMVGRKGSEIASVVVFDAPAGMEANTSISETRSRNGSTIILTAHATGVAYFTSIVYANGIGMPAMRVVTSDTNPHPNSAVVTFDAVTGAVLSLQTSTGVP
jgi:Tol biopolymer transport system component